MKKEISFLQWFKAAEDLTKKRSKWHTHIFSPSSTPKCIYNKGNKFILILENEDTGEIFTSKSKSQKKEDMKKLNKILFLEMKKTLKDTFPHR